MEGGKLRLHHVGFVVASISASVDGFVSGLNLSWNREIFIDPIQGVKVTFLTMGVCAQIELVEPLSDRSPVTAFLNEKKGGLHHLCYEVDDLEKEVAAMQSRGVKVVRQPQPAVAFGGRRIAWLITRQRLLVELLETALPV